MPYTIGEIAKKLNLASSTLRYYDKEGLLPFVERSSGGIRIFQESDLNTLEIIECLKESGMPIAEIKTFIDLCMEGDATIEDRLAIIQRRYDAVLEQQKKLQETLHLLEYKKWYYEQARAAGTCSIHDTMTMEDIPLEFLDVAQKILERKQPK